MADEKNNDDNQEPVIRDKRRVDPETGDVREPSEGAGADAPAPDDSPDGTAPEKEEEVDELSDEDQALLEQASRDLVAEMRTDMLRAQAELVNFRQRVERDRAANRDAVIAEVIRSLLPAMDDLARAEAHGDLVEGAPLTLVAQKLRSAFEKYGLKQVGEKGEPFDPAFHEAVVQLPSEDVTINTIADVIEPGYILGDRLVRAAKVAVFVPAE
ncbi:MAG: nucleotide exchange factor GrpE [Rhodoglobus sp.]|nr:nucleotide exchange factor GrpE [Rhodoglobus sp.]